MLFLFPIFLAINETLSLLLLKKICNNCVETISKLSFWRKSWIFHWLLACFCLCHRSQRAHLQHDYWKCPTCRKFSCLFATFTPNAPQWLPQFVRSAISRLAIWPTLDVSITSLISAACPMQAPPLILRQLGQLSTHTHMGSANGTYFPPPASAFPGHHFPSSYQLQLQLQLLWLHFRSSAPLAKNELQQLPPNSIWWLRCGCFFACNTLHASHNGNTYNGVCASATEKHIYLIDFKYLFLKII